MIHQGLATMHSNALPKDLRILGSSIHFSVSLSVCTQTYGAEVCAFCDVLGNTKVRGRQRHDEQQSISGLLTD